MSFQYACADFTFPLLSHDNVLKLIAMLGFDGVDVGLFQDRSHLQPVSEFAQLTQNAQKLRKSLDANGLLLCDVFLQTANDFASVAINHPEEAVRRKARKFYEQTLEYACEAGGKHITILPGVVFEEEGRAASLARACEELLWRIDLAGRHGLILAVEPHVGSLGGTPADALELANACPGLTFAVDYTHFTKQGFSDAEIQPLLRYASHFHARGAKPGALQTVVSESTIDYAAVIRQLQALQYKGYIGVEYTWNDWENCNKTDNVSESILLKRLLQNAEASACGN